MVDLACKLQLPDLNASVTLLVLINAKSQLLLSNFSLFRVARVRRNCSLLKYEQTIQTLYS